LEGEVLDSISKETEIDFCSGMKLYFGTFIEFEKNP
jgi:hypothetical protein